MVKFDNGYFPCYRIEQKLEAPTVFYSTPTCLIPFILLHRHPNKAFRGHSHPDQMLSGALTNQDPPRPPRRYQYKSPERHPQLPYRPSKDRRLCFDGADHLAGDYFGVRRNP